MEVLETGDKALSSHKRRTMVKHWQFCAVRSFARDANCIQAHNQLIPRSPHSIVPHLAMGLYNIALESLIILSTQVGWVVPRSQQSQRSERPCGLASWRMVVRPSAWSLVHRWVLRSLPAEW